MSRREFTRAVKVAIIKRASRAIGDTILCEQYCEKCGDPTKGRFEIHHLIEDALEIDKKRPLTAKDGALWCIPCHKAHTASVSIPAVAKAKRREAVHLGARRDKQPIKSDLDALKSRHRPKHEGRAPLPPRPLFFSLGAAATRVLRKLSKP